MSATPEEDITRSPDMLRTDGSPRVDEIRKVSMIPNLVKIEF